jgi:carboxymethylenebutenolidase
MADEPDQKTDISRRDFVTLSVAAGFGLAAGTTSEAAVPVVEDNATITTSDGTCDAAFIHPTTSAHPGVLIWPDAFGLRPVMREIGKRIAGEGYSVLVPNPFYRLAKAPVFDDPSKFNFANQTDMARLQSLMGSINAPGAAERDATAFIAWLDMQRQVDTGKKIGTQGYCMGGPLVVKTAATVPNRVGAGASFHGGGLVTDQPTSPHLLAPNIKARMYFGVASNDDMRQPDAKVKLKQAFEAAKVPVEVELYPMALHGWCIRDMPFAEGKPIYKMDDAEHAWAQLVTLYAGALQS